MLLSVPTKVLLLAAITFTAKDAIVAVINSVLFIVFISYILYNTGRVLLDHHSTKSAEISSNFSPADFFFFQFVDIF